MANSNSTSYLTDYDWFTRVPQHPNKAGFAEWAKEKLEGGLSGIYERHGYYALNMFQKHQGWKTAFQYSQEFKYYKSTIKKYVCIASLRQSIKGYTLEFYFTDFNIGNAISWLR